MPRRYIRGKALPLERLLGPQPIEGLMNSGQAAKYLGKARASIYRWRDNGWLRPTVLSPIALYSKEELDRFRRENLQEE